MTFQAGELSTEVAMNAMYSYLTAAPYFDKAAIALSLVLCSAVRWTVCERATVPGTDTLVTDLRCRGGISIRRHRAGPKSVVVSG